MMHLPQVLKITKKGLTKMSVGNVKYYVSFILSLSMAAFKRMSWQVQNLCDIIPSCLGENMKITPIDYGRINSTKSPASSVDNFSESRLMSQVGRVREVVCA
jgi:hypothetical protein